MLKYNGRILRKELIGLKKAKKIIAIALVLIFIFTLVFSMAGLIISVHHNCVGIHCLVCERIAVVQNAVSIVKFLALALFVSLLILLRIKEGIALKSSFLCKYHTEITLKTQLNI